MLNVHTLISAASRCFRRGGAASTLGGRARSSTAMLVQERAPSRATRLNERGTVAVMTAMLAVPLIGVSALAVDVGAWEMNTNAMQDAADRAALAAGLVMSAGTGVAQNEARAVAAAHGYVHNVGAVDVAVTFPPMADGGSGIEVVITQPQQKLLSGVLLASSPIASVKAVAGASQAKTCIMALAPTGAGIKSSGSGMIDAGTCNIYVNSTSACDVVLSGNLKIKGLDVFLGEPGTPACVQRPAGSVSATRNLKLASPPAKDPYEKRAIPVPASSCASADITKSVISLNPGTHCNLNLSGTKTVNLAPGLHVFDNASIRSSSDVTINGTNVSLVFTGSSPGGIFSSNSLSINLTPMKAGPTAGIAIWIDKRGDTGIKSSGNLGLNIAGAVYIPGSDITWSGNVNSPCTQLIARSIVFSGTANFRHECSGYGVESVSNTGGYKLKG